MIIIKSPIKIIHKFQNNGNHLSSENAHRLCVHNTVLHLHGLCGAQFLVFRRTIVVCAVFRFVCGCCVCREIGRAFPAALQIFESSCADSYSCSRCDVRTAVLHESTGLEGQIVPLLPDFDIALQTPRPIVPLVHAALEA